MSIGDNIKRFRKRKGLTQNKLGELCGMSESQIGQYENCIRNPKKETLDKIAKALEVDYFELIEAKKTTYPDTKKNMTNIVNFYGKYEQSRIAMEECAELIQAINKIHRYPDNKQRKTDLVEEMADVAIMLHQLMIMYDIDDYEFNSMLKKKKERIMQKFEHDYEEYTEDFEI